MGRFFHGFLYKIDKMDYNYFINRIQIKIYTKCHTQVIVLILVHLM